MVKAFQLKHKGLVAITLEEEDEEEEEDHDEPVAETRVEESEGDSSDDDNPNNNKDSNNGPSHSKANDQRTPLGLGGGKRNSTVVAAGAASSASSPNRRRLNRHASSSGGAAATGSDGGGDSDSAASFHNLRISPSLAGAFQSSPSPRCGARVLYLPTSLRLQFDEKRELLFNRYGLKLLAIKQFFQTHMNPLLLIQYKHWGSQQTVPLPKQLGVTLDVAGLAVRMATAPMRAPSSRKAQSRNHRKSSKPSPTDAAASQRSNAERSAEIIHRHSRLFSSLFREVPCVTTFLQNAFWFFFLEFYSLAESVDRFDQHRIDLVDGLSYTVENIIGDEAGAGEDDPRHIRTATIVEPENPVGGGAPQSSVARGSISPKGAPPLIGFPPTSAIAATTTVQDEDRNAILMLLGPAAGSAGARNKCASGGGGVQRELDNAFRLHHDSTAGGGGAAAAMQASFLSGSLQSSVRRPKTQQQPTASRSTTAHHSGLPQQGRLGATTTTTNQEGPTSGGGPASSSSSGSDSDDAILGAPDATHKKRKQKGALHDGKNSGNVTQSGGGAVGGSASVLHNSGGGGGGGGGVNMEAQRRITLLKQFSRRYLTRTSKTPSHVIHEADYQLRFRGRHRTSHHRRSHRRGPGGGDDALSSTRDSSGSEDGYTSAMSYGTLVSSPGSATTEDGEEDPLNDDHLAYLLSAEGKKTHDEEEEEFPLPLRTPDPLNGPRVPLSARSKKLRKSLRTPSTASHRGGGTAGSGAPAPNVRLVQGERDPMQAVLLLLHSGCLDLTQEQFDALVHELHSTSPEAVVKEQLLIRDACELIEIEQHRIFGRMARSYLAILKAVRQGSVSASSNYRGECTTTNGGLTPRVPSSAPTSALRPSTSMTTATTVLESSIPPLALTSLSDKRDGARAEAELVAQHLPYFLAKVVTQLLYLLMPYGRDILTRRARRHIFKKMTYWALGVEDRRLPKAPLPVPPPKKSAQSTGGDFNGSGGGGGGGPITQQQQNPSASLLHLNESRRSPRAGGGARHGPCPPSLNASLRGGGPRTAGAVSSPRTGGLGGAAATSHGQSTVGGRSVRNAISPDSNLAHTNNNNNNPATLLNTLSSANVTLPSIADTEAEERQLAMERGLEAFHKARADITNAFDYLLATGNVQLMNAATHSTMRPNSRHSTVSGGGAGDEGGDPLFAAAAAAGAAAATRRRKKAQEELRHLETHRHAPSNRLPELWHAQGRPSSRAVGLLLSDANKGRFDTALLTPFTKRVLVEQGIDIHRDTNKKMVRWTS